MKNIAIFLYIFFAVCSYSYAQSTDTTQSILPSDTDISYEYSIVPTNTSGYKYGIYNDQLDQNFIKRPNFKKTDAFLQIRVFATRLHPTPSTPGYPKLPFLTRSEVNVMDNGNRLVQGVKATFNPLFVWWPNGGKALIKTYYIGITTMDKWGTCDGYLCYNQEYRIDIRHWGQFLGESKERINPFVDNTEIIKIPAVRSLGQHDFIRYSGDGKWFTGDVVNLNNTCGNCGIK